MATISIYSKTSSSVTLYLTSLDTSWTDGIRTVYWYLGSGGGGIPTENAYYKSATASLSNGISSGGNVTFTGLNASTQYGIYCTVYHGSKYLTELQGFVTTDSGSSSGGGDEPTTVTKWDWFGVNGDAWAEETMAAYNAVVNKKATTDFSRWVWNDMVAKVYEIAMASTKYWDSHYASRYDTLINKSPCELTAVKFNSLRNNIELVGNYVGLGYRTGIGVVAPGDVVYGEYFITLTNYMNACIDKL